ncbi:hypothetical protein [Halomontanus rarus]|uniref:hypothetical protein n=1 Tax=Halomontanus rarus TaxID=3034020 RepID=UPI0023E7AE7F|nr:hypothetical protein [Halovivax sp. TS33]
MGLSDVVRGLLADGQSRDDPNDGSPSPEESSVAKPKPKTEPDPETVVYECRNCGTTVSPDETCPTCGSTAIAEYPVD